MTGKNSEQVLDCLREAGWSLQNLIIWEELTSAVPNESALWQAVSDSSLRHQRQ